MFDRYIFVIGLLGLSFLITECKQKESNNVVSLTTNSFEAKIIQIPHFVMFFAPWCGHCQRLAPVWKQLATEMKDYINSKEIVIAKVDCTVETSLCSKQDVTGYPTLKFFKSGKVHSYNNGRSLNEIKRYAKSMIGVTGDEGNDVPSLTQENFDGKIAKKTHFIMFFAPWCGHCQKLFPTWKELAKKFKNQKEIVIAKVDCTVEKKLCLQQAVNGYPTLKLFRAGQVKAYDGDRNLEGLMNYVQSTVPIETSEDTYINPNIAIFDEKSFQTSIESGVTFALFFVDRCEHCKRLAMRWNELAEKFAGSEDVKIGKMDCTAKNDIITKFCDGQGATVFPTLNIYKDGQKISKYNGKQTTKALYDFVSAWRQQHSTAKTYDEL